MENAVEETKGGLPATGAPVQGPEILGSDLVLEKILLMQGLSELVGQRKAQLGDIVKSVSHVKLGDIETPIQFVPLTFKNKWMLQEFIPGKEKPEFRGMEERNAKNENYDWNFDKDGTKWRRVKVLEVFALLMSDIEAQKDVKAAIEAGETPDLDSTLLPVVISFRSTSFKGGQSIVTHFAKAAQLTAEHGQLIKPYGYWMELSAHPDKNDKGSFFVYKTKTGKKIEGEALAAAERWVATLSTRTDIRVDESDEVSAGESSGVDSGGGSTPF